MLLFLVPVVDCLRLIAVRLSRYGTPFVGDRNHLHHILQRLLPEGAALASYWSLVGVPSLLALLLPKATPWWVLLSLAAYAFALAKDAHDRRVTATRAYEPEGIPNRFSASGSDD
jgi:UDP-GlcNAc:undecaprenyl-phosphate GlcNAc-1-phosphate transferase